MASLFQPWFLFAALAGLCFFTYQFCVKIVGQQIPMPVFILIMNIASAIFIAPFALSWFGGQTITIEAFGKPLIAAIVSGITMILASTFLSLMYKNGAPISLGMSAAYIVALGLATCVGYLFFKEQLNIINIIGFGLAIITIPMIMYKS